MPGAATDRDPPTRGRVFETATRVRLADAAPTGRLRLDAIARMLQDVASDDSADAGLDDAGPGDGGPGDGGPGGRAGSGVWVMRRLSLRLDSVARFGDDVLLRTWCSGIGRCWAERRTDLIVSRGATPATPNGRGATARAAAIWVYVARTGGQPLTLPARFHDQFAAAAAGRTVSARLTHPAPPAGAPRAPWRVRAVDLDVLGHVNNAAYWAPVEQWLQSSGDRVTRAEIEFRAPIEPGEAVELATRLDALSAGARQLRQWWEVCGTVRASAIVETAPP